MDDDTIVTPELIEWLIINSIDVVDDDEDGIPDDAVYGDCTDALDRVETATVEKDYEAFIDDLEMVETAMLLSKKV
ncbi:MAG: hypothetical protein BWK79_20160 [Beggiatoa sp. IS2]|nr:MAG: hypothetical protein BWK79_20160 [Beggiatoa sp. IS2]